MTHDELMKLIYERIEDCQPDCNKHKWINAPWLALRAVVELHKPVINPNSKEPDSWCFQCAEGRYYAKYPCPTIQAIEKELE